MTFTYTDQDEQQILRSIQDLVKRRLVELIFKYANDGAGLYEDDFNEIKSLIDKEIFNGKLF